MEIRNLRTFLQVAEQNSFTAAANTLGYSQSTVSFQIKQLEDELSCLLFDRINHTLTLTQRGRELLEYAQKVLNLTCQPHTAFLLRMPVFSGYFGGSGTRQKWCKNLNFTSVLSYHLPEKFCTYDVTLRKTITLFHS